MATPKLRQSSLDGRYRLVRVLRETGVSTRYEAEHLVVGRRVAVEVLAPELAGDPELRVRFEKQARCLGVAAHPNLANILDLGTTNDGRCYVALELPPGETLAQRVARGPLSLELALSLMEQVLAGLAAAHASGVPYPILEPESIVVTELDRGHPQVKLCDFSRGALEDASRLEANQVKAAARLFVTLVGKGIYRQLVSPELGAFLDYALAPTGQREPTLADLRQLMARERSLDLRVTRLPSVRVNSSFVPSWPCSVPVAQCRVQGNGGFWSISESMLVAPRIPPAANTPQLDPKHSPIPVALPASTQQPPQRPRKLRMALVFAGSAAVGLLVSWAAGIF